MRDLLWWILLPRLGERLRRLPSRDLRIHFGPVNARLHRYLRSGQLFAFSVHHVHELPRGKILCIDRRFGLYFVLILRRRSVFNGRRRNFLGDLCWLCFRHVLDDGRRLELFDLRELLDGLLHRDDGRHELHELPFRPVRGGRVGLVRELRGGHVPDELHLGKLHGMPSRHRQSRNGSG